MIRVNKNSFLIPSTGTQPSSNTPLDIPLTAVSTKTFLCRVTGIKRWRTGKPDSKPPSDSLSSAFLILLIHLWTYFCSYLFIYILISLNLTMSFCHDVDIKDPGSSCSPAGEGCRDQSAPAALRMGAGEAPGTLRPFY